MAKLKTNILLTFASLVLATLALFALPTAFDGHLSVGDAYLSADTEYTAPSADNQNHQSGNAYLDSESPLQSALFLGNRRPFSQVSLRPQRGGSRLRHGISSEPVSRPRSLTLFPRIITFLR